jgi:gamma-glutamyltranspeptidase
VGNVASCTLTIEQTGCSGITVPGYGFLLNNELTDINFAPTIATGALGAELRALGHTVSTNPEIGAATAIRILPHGRFLAAAETTRRGGGAAVVNPRR